MDEKIDKLRWNSNVMFDNNGIDHFWQEHFKKDHKLLFIQGKGFDVRMNFTLDRLLKICPTVNIEFLLVDLNEGEDSNSFNYQDLLDENLSEFEKLVGTRDYKHQKIDIWSDKTKNKRKIGDRKAAELFTNYDQLESYTDIMIDISSLPRGIYFSLIGKILRLIDLRSDRIHNLFISVAENVRIDSLIDETASEDDLSYLHGFGGGIELESEVDKPLIWFPILGENKSSHILKGSDMITSNKTRLYEICPVLPFPSKDPRRSEAMLIEYHDLLFDTLDIEPQNIMYTTERNPFEAYIQLSEAIHNYKKSLKIINGCKAAISNFSSKLLSIGSLLVAYENSDSIGILNLNNRDYEIRDIEEFKSAKDESEIFVTWLTGIPYIHQ